MGKYIDTKQDICTHKKNQIVAHVLRYILGSQSVCHAQLFSVLRKVL